MSAPVRSQPRNTHRTPSRPSAGGPRRACRSPSNSTMLEPSSASNDAMSPRQSRKATSRSSPSVHWSRSAALPSSSTRRIDPERTFAFERLQRSSTQSVHEQARAAEAPLRSDGLRSAASMNPSARASIPASSAPTSSTSSQLSPSAAESVSSTAVARPRRARERQVPRRASPASQSGARTEPTILSRSTELPLPRGRGRGPARHQTAGSATPPTGPQHQPTREYSVAHVGIRELLEAGVHFGHQTRRWNPEDAPLHLRRARRDPHHRPAADRAAARAGAGVRRRHRRARRHGHVRRHQEAGAATPSRRPPSAPTCRTSTSAGWAACSPTSRRSPADQAPARPRRLGRERHDGAAADARAHQGHERAREAHR